jgi:hypothetical protein
MVGLHSLAIRKAAEQSIAASRARMREASLPRCVGRSLRAASDGVAQGLRERGVFA